MNVLWFQTDEERPDALGCDGSRWARTPHVDALAERGVVFRAAVCQSPVCLPSRSSQLAARYPHEFGCLNNSILDHEPGFPARWTTFPQRLRQLGWQTVNCGRYHAMSRDVFEVNHQQSDYVGAHCDHFGLAPVHDERRWRVLKRPGTHHRPLIIAGTYPGGEDNPCRRSSDRAIRWLRDERDAARPFLLRVSYNWPHTPTLAPEPWDRLYDADALPIVPFDAAARDGRAGFDRAYAALHRMDLLDDAQRRQLWTDYMGCCAYVDHEMGRVLAVIDELGLRDDTLIIFSSDHGKSLGEWGTGEKGTFDRPVWGVPFVWSCPGVLPEGEVRDEPCELVDTARTIFGALGLAGDADPTWRGRDLFRDPPAEHAFGVIRAPSADIPDLDPDLMRVAVRDRRYRMDAYRRTDGGDPGDARADGNLFDLVEDPLERLNRYGDPALAGVRARLHAALDRWLQEAPSDPRLLAPENAGRLF